MGFKFRLPGIKICVIKLHMFKINPKIDSIYLLLNLSNDNKYRYLMNALSTDNIEEANMIFNKGEIMRNY